MKNKTIILSKCKERNAHDVLEKQDVDRMVVHDWNEVMPGRNLWRWPKPTDDIKCQKKNINVRFTLTNIFVLFEYQ